MVCALIRKNRNEGLIIKFLLLFTTIVCLFNSCQKNASDVAKNKSSEGADSMAVLCYKMQVDGNFQDYVKAMKSCDKMPNDYQQRIVKMLRHHQKFVMKEKKGVKKVDVLRTEMHNKNLMANVFLNVSYNDGSVEEVLLPMVYDGNRWRMQ